jgi:hypothetical protein
VLGPIQQVSNSTTEIATGDPSQEHQEQQQAESQEQAQDKKKDKDKDDADDSDDGSNDPAFGIINSGPVQVKTELEQPVTSGGMDTMNQVPGPQD